MHVEIVRRIFSLAVAFVFFSSFAPMTFAQERDRSKIPDQYKWDLTAIYPSDQAWRTAKEQFVAELPKIRELQGTLASSPNRLADALELSSRLEKELNRLFVYAGLISDQDTRVSAYQAMKQEMLQLGARFGAETAFIEPEILKIDKATVDRFVAEEPRLKVYRQYLDDIQRRRAHTLNDAEEKILAGAGVMAGAPASIFGIFADADFPYPTVVLSDGKSVKLDKAAFSLYRAGSSREDRQKVMAAFFGALGAYSGTYGSLLNAKVQGATFYARSHKYGSVLEASLDSANIPTSVYMRLIDGVNKNLPTFHRYLKLRKRMMGLQELHYYDLYAPLVQSVDLKYSVEEAQRNILTALAPLGPEYAAGAKRAFSERWIDLYPSELQRQVR